MGFGIIIFLLIGAIFVYLVVIYNRFASLRTGINASWADIEVQLKRRYDLVPALIDTIKGYNEYESQTLEDIIKVRQEGLEASSMEEKSLASNKISSAFGKIFALAEAYPDLKANSNFFKLQEELSSLEDALQSARRYYNAIVRDYNYRLEAFPDVLVANYFSYPTCEYFELAMDESEKAYKMPDINL